MLGHHYLLHGKVIHGQKLGRHLGYPTANLQPGHDRKLIPIAGIYAVYAHVDKTILPGVVYIGKKSTVTQHLTTDSIELYCLDYEGDLYDKEIYIEMVAYIREDQHFDNTEQLTQQIAEDVLNAKSILTGTQPSFSYA
jgi:riboflavin kinase/FMN adenylyltransferase